MILSDAVIDAIAERLAARLEAVAKRRLVRKADLCLALSLTVAQVDRACRAGMPREYLDGLPRFDVDACLAWLRARPRRAKPVGCPSDIHSRVRRLGRKVA